MVTLLSVKISDVTYPTMNCTQEHENMTQEIFLLLFGCMRKTKCKLSICHKGSKTYLS